VRERRTIHSTAPRLASARCDSFRFLVEMGALNSFDLGEFQRIREGFPGQRSAVLPRSIVSAWLDSDPLFDMLPSDVGYYPHAQWHFVERPECSPQLVFIHCVDGEGWSRINGNTFRIRPGQALVIPPWVPHAYGADPVSPWTIYWIHMAGAKAATLVRLLEIGLSSPTLFPGQDPALPALFEKILFILSHGYSADSLMAAATALHQMVAPPGEDPPPAVGRRGQTRRKGQARDRIHDPVAG